jgi:RNA 2',3'-cyclic 3'-phosphodiesterase
MPRLFVAIGLPPPVRSSLAALQAGVPGARWTPEENLHLTLRFIGELDGAGFEDAVSALAEVEAPSFELQLAGVGQFGDRRRAHALWAGVRPSEPLALLRGRVEAALARAGMPRDERKFAPHVTLARLREAPLERVAGFLSGHGLYEGPSFAVTSFELYSSRLAHTHAQHLVEAEYPLNGA